MKCLKCRQKIIVGKPKYGLHPQCFTRWFKVDPQKEFKGITQRSSYSKDLEMDAIYSANNTSFFHGKFKKYSADLASDTYIFKMRMKEEAPELPEVEYLCNQIGRFVGLPVPEFFYIDFHSEKVFVTKVFIKKGSAATNLEHIYKYRSDDKHNCETLVKLIRTVTRRPYDVDVFSKMILFDAFIGNHDRHGRNMAFIVTSTKISLAPIYDNVSYLSLVYGDMLKADYNPTGRIATAVTKEPSMIHYVRELKRLGQEELVKEFLGRIKIQKIAGLVDSSFCSKDMKGALKRLLQKRYQELLDGLQN